MDPILKIMAAPTLVVSAKDYYRLRYERCSVYEIHGRRGLKVVPETAQEIGENIVTFPTGPKHIVFRKRFTRQKTIRNVRYITADNSDRYDTVFTVYLK